MLETHRHRKCVYVCPNSQKKSLMTYSNKTSKSRDLMLYKSSILQLTVIKIDFSDEF